MLNDAIFITIISLFLKNFLILKLKLLEKSYACVFHRNHKKYNYECRQ